MQGVYMMNNELVPWTMGGECQTTGWFRGQRVRSDEQQLGSVKQRVSFVNNGQEVPNKVNEH